MGDTLNFSGVIDYKVRTGTIKNSFPVTLHGELKDCCDFCRFYKKYDNECIITGEKIVEAKTYRGYVCPLTEEVESGGSTEKDTAGT